MSGAARDRALDELVNETTYHLEGIVTAADAIVGAIVEDASFDGKKPARDLRALEYLTNRACELVTEVRDRLEGRLPSGPGETSA